MRVLRAIRRVFVPYTPLVEVEISRRALLDNISAYQQETRLPVAPVLKSNAYGHGLYEVASIVQVSHPPFLIVDSLYEAIFLRRNGIRVPILVIGYTAPENIVRVRARNVVFVMTNLMQLRSVCKTLGRPIRVHLKVDTGMSRQGILPQELDQALQYIEASSHVQLEGICSHFACADEADFSVTSTQLGIWREVLARVHAYTKLRYWHVSATAGIHHITSEDSNVLRLGIGMYGIDPAGNMNDRLRPALSMYAPIVGIKHIPKGAIIGYGATVISDRPMCIATLPLGYFEGIDRRLSNKGFVIVRGKVCRIVGRVSMNITLVDVTDVIDVEVGDRVLVFGGSHEGASSVMRLADTAQTIPYELLIHIPQHLRRIIVS